MQLFLGWRLLNHIVGLGKKGVMLQPLSSITRFPVGKMFTGSVQRLGENDVTKVPESALQPLSTDEIFHVRTLAAA